MSLSETIKAREGFILVDTTDDQILLKRNQWDTLEQAIMSGKIGFAKFDDLFGGEVIIRLMNVNYIQDIPAEAHRRRMEEDRIDRMGIGWPNG
jgi:hypothetical protein